jgi:quercetin dioxygenase-like cupin family protein
MPRHDAIFSFRRSGDDVAGQGVETDAVSAIVFAMIPLGCYKSGSGKNPRGGDVFMNRFSLIAGLAIAVLLPAAAIADDQHVIAQPDSLKWTAAPPVLPKGAQIAALYGDPDKAEPFVFRLKFPAGYKVAAHMHPNDYDVTVLSGTMYLGMGDKLDPARGEGLNAGGYLHLPKGMHHYEWANEDTVIQLSGVGPVGMTYLNPADDPRKMQ